MKLVVQDVGSAGTALEMKNYGQCICLMLYTLNYERHLSSAFHLGLQVYGM